MQIKLSLNKDREVIWSLPQSKTYLTLDTPEAFFELEELTPLQKTTIVSGLRTKKIISDTKPEEIIPLKPVAAASIQPSQPQEVIPEINTQPARAKEILSGNVSDIRKQILITNDLKLLRVMINQEEGSGKRVTVLKALREQIEALMAEVAKSVATEHAPAPIIDPAKERRGGKTVDYDVVESDQVPITLKIEKYTP